MNVCWYVSSCVCKSVHGNLEPFLTGIWSVPVYHTDYTTVCVYVCVCIFLHLCECCVHCCKLTYHEEFPPDGGNFLVISLEGFIFTSCKGVPERTVSGGLWNTPPCAAVGRSGTWSQLMCVRCHLLWVPSSSRLNVTSSHMLWTQPEAQFNVRGAKCMNVHSVQNQSVSLWVWHGFNKPSVWSAGGCNTLQTVRTVTGNRLYLKHTHTHCSCCQITQREENRLFV